MSGTAQQKPHSEGKSLYGLDVAGAIEDPAPPRWLSWMGPLAEIGVPSDLLASQAKHIRFCNLAALAGGVCAVVFVVLSLPIIADWGSTTAMEFWVIAGSALTSLPLFVPLLLNHQEKYAAARVVLVVAGASHVVWLQFAFAAAAPAHLFLIIIAAMSTALFPQRERGRMWVLISTCFVLFMLSLWLRTRNDPLIEVRRPVIRHLMEYCIAAGAMIFAVVITCALRSTTRRAELQAQREQDRADRLLLNILPEQIANRLKMDPSTIADGFREVTVLFADLVGFTPMSQTMTPIQTLEMVNKVFSRFDALIDRFGLEKIKTIGDAYMLAGGLPTPVRTHASDVARMALAMREAIQSLQGPDGSQLRLRIGIATGPVVAGVIGRKKFLYDLWGQTVNTASRMESCGEADRIQVNESAWLCLKNQFSFQERGLIEVKGQGMVRTWFLEGALQPQTTAEPDRDSATRDSVPVAG